MPIGKSDAAAQAAAEAARRAAAEKAREAARKAAEEAKAAATRAAAAASAKAGVKAGLSAGIGREASKRLGLKDRFSSKAMKPIRGGLKAEAGLGAGLGATVGGVGGGVSESTPTFKPSQLQSLGKNPMAAYIGSADNNVASIENPTSKKLLDTRRELEAAQNKVDSNKAELAEQLRRLGPNLTEAQKKQYIEKFNARHQGDTDKATEVAQRAAQTLEEARTATPRASPTELLETAKVLAKTPAGAKAAKDYVQQVASDPSSPEYQALVKDTGSVEGANKALQDVLKEAIPNMVLDGLERTGGDPKATAEYIKKELEALDGAKSIVGNVAQVGKAMEALSNGDFKALENIGAGPYGDTVKVAGVIIGMAKVANGTAEIQDVLGITKDSLELTATALKSFGRMAAGKVLEKIAVPLGIVGGIISTGADYEAWRKDGKNGDGMKALGNALTTIGCICALSGAGAPIGAILGVAGSTLTAAGTIMNMKQEEADRSKEQYEILKDMGVEDGWAKVLASNERFADPTTRTEWLGGTPEQMRKRISDGSSDDNRAFDNYTELIGKFSPSAKGHPDNISAQTQFKEFVAKSPNLTPEDRAFLERWKKNDKRAKAPPGFSERMKQVAQDFITNRTATWGATA